MLRRRIPRKDERLDLLRFRRSKILRYCSSQDFAAHSLATGCGDKTDGDDRLGVSYVETDLAKGSVRLIAHDVKSTRGIGQFPLQPADVRFPGDDFLRK